MIPLFIVLLTAHLLGDFIFQSDGMAKKKWEGEGLIWHAIIVTIISWILLGVWPLQFAWIFIKFNVVFLIGAIFVSHLVIDAVKVFLGADNVQTFLVDQGFHFAALALIAWIFRNSLVDSLWTPIGEVYVSVLAVAAGLILTVKFGSVLIEKAMKPIIEQMQDSPLKGLENGGKWIGMLERALTFLLVLTGQVSAIGFLLAAKSILRFGEVKSPGQRKEAEYIIIGTFMSFGWALFISMIFKSLLHIG